MHAVGEWKLKITIFVKDEEYLILLMIEDWSFEDSS